MEHFTWSLNTWSLNTWRFNTWSYQVTWNTWNTWSYLEYLRVTKVPIYLTRRVKHAVETITGEGRTSSRFNGTSRFLFTLR
jgi:hypothetical protein